MRNLNRVELMGYTGQEPEMRFTPNGKAITTFSLATSRYFKTDAGEERKETQWHNLKCWGKLAEVVNQRLEKGKPVYISGRLEYDKWESQDGVKHSKPVIVVEDLIFLGSNGAIPSTEESVSEDIPF